jgi:PAS domain S-box-containing protein
LGALDRALATAARDMEQPLIIENLSRAKTLVTREALGGPIEAAIALPVRTKDQVPAVMWMGYGATRQFDEAEIAMLSMLASQTAVLVENARLFQSAEGGRRRLAAILASTTDAVLVTDREDRILLVNPAAERAFGVAASVVTGQKIDQAGLSPALVRVFEEPLFPEEALTEEVPLFDGRTLYASVSTIISTDGERMGRVAVMRDITHLKELDEMKSEFVATVSHDLRAPLTFMRGYATMLPTVGELNEKQREYAEKILRGVGQMSKLVDDLLNLGRIEAGVGLERHPCHLGAILVEAVDGMRARASAKGLTLRLEPTAGVAIVAGDAALLRQAITNLVDNAIKYTPGNGVVTVGLSVSDGRAVIHVTDTGIGVAPSDQVRLFEKFYRIKRRDTPDVPGTGLGLSIVKSIIERHDGKVWVDSELNKGSTFHISLPLSDARVAVENRDKIKVSANA